MDPVIIIHGGASTVAQERICGKMCGVQTAAKEGLKVLQKGSSAVDAIEAAIRILESNVYFNCGLGSVLTYDATVEMDASLMDGSDLSAGACSGVCDVEHPISLARLVRDQSPHILMYGAGASRLACEKGISIIPMESLITDYSKEILATFHKLGNVPETRELGGSVGAVALDKDGNLAAGTSTGGTNGKLVGRIGDSSIIGGGTYADNHAGAVSCSGHGEAILKISLGHSIVTGLGSCKSPTDVVESCIQNLTTRTGSTAGAIAINKKGEVGLFFSSSMMPWCYIKNGELHSGLRPGQHDTKSL